MKILPSKEKYPQLMSGKIALYVDLWETEFNCFVFTKSENCKLDFKLKPQFSTRSGRYFDMRMLDKKIVGKNH